MMIVSTVLAAAALAAVLVAQGQPRPELRPVPVERNRRAQQR